MRVTASHQIIMKKKLLMANIKSAHNDSSACSPAFVCLIFHHLTPAVASSSTGFLNVPLNVQAADLEVEVWNDCEVIVTNLVLEKQPLT